MNKLRPRWWEGIYLLYKKPTKTVSDKYQWFWPLAALKRVNKYDKEYLSCLQLLSL